MSKAQDGPLWSVGGLALTLAGREKAAAVEGVRWLAGTTAVLKELLSASPWRHRCVGGSRPWRWSGALSGVIRVAPGTPIEFSSGSGALSWWGLSAGAPVQLGGLACVAGASAHVHGSLVSLQHAWCALPAWACGSGSQTFVLLLLWAPVRPCGGCVA